MTEKGFMSEEDLNAAFADMDKTLKEAFDGLEDQLAELETELNSEETQKAFREMAEELERIDLSSELEELDIPTPDIPLPDFDSNDLLGGSHDGKEQ